MMHVQLNRVVQQIRVPGDSLNADLTMTSQMILHWTIVSPFAVMLPTGRIIAWVAA